MAEAEAGSELDFLKRTLENNINSFRTKRISSRRSAFRFKLIVVALGVLTTIILGLKPYVKIENGEAVLSILALILSGIIPVFTAWDAFFDYRWLWVKYTGTLNVLYGIRDEVEYAISKGLPPREKVDDLFDRMQRALEEIDSAWSSQRTKQAGEHGK